MNIKQWQERLAAFAAERDWDQFHSPKNLSSALVVEAAELLEQFQWLTQEGSRAEYLSDKTRSAIEQEIADVGIYLLRLCDILDVDLEGAIEKKLEINAEKYPVELAKGNAVKYSDR
ncbi:MAG: nucleotide pyrophosphohydrolase [Bacteroidetes bacterium]|nr:nucleotide pyrophosphohydrolase [Bacteroidota bacterium]